ncbi:hypothetical protein [Spirosoma montaniterrae]|uniref:Uncharacterized protein n=1 Tax=Spirosoma montaniterrae TaxID=1178516 RepID=A0A1P9X3C7_9BACT|nr:hypothetical protein [Spirosoma montaniterrae]AQG82132.1 hypothetical protein AWR27_24245 [Spirosoma montaniterrae]
MNDELNADDRADLVAGLFDRIDHLNRVIEQRRASADTDPLAVEEFTARRDKYVRELNKLLWSIGLTGELHMPRMAA